jgi:hypothetical protein
MKMISSFLSRHSHSLIFYLSIFTLIALVCSTPSFCGDIRDAAQAGDLAKVKPLLHNNPELVSGKNNPFTGVQLEVGLNKSSAESAEQQSPGRKPWDQA